MSMARYMQVHRVESPLEATLREQRIGSRAAIEDEKRFIDFSRSAIWIGKERIVFDER